ncbi:MAG TPA: family 43 glycosylhydrolase [Micromonosporaceae bacterium]|nr:family 43 glycosylhydrolase [Micromonosporaceae bacterium]
MTRPGSGMPRRRVFTIAAATGLGLTALPLTRGLITPASAAPVGAWGDQGDGTYVNQIVPADLSDLDAIRVGNDYYAISSTMQFSPGMAVLHSTDLVNWSIISHAAGDLLQMGPEYNWDRMNRQGKGVWAGAIRHHAGRFWVYYNTPDEGFFVTSAVNPAGPWEPLTSMWRTTGWNDVCPFWDDNGQGYLATTNYADAYKIYLIPLGPDNRSLVTGSRRLIHQSSGSEASKLYKINGRYYHLYSETRGGARVVMMNRSTSLFGPYENRQIQRGSASVDREPNQGGLIQAPSGSWYWLTHHGSGGHWEGRSMSLVPVTWVDNWPILGAVGSDGVGTMVWGGRVPAGGVPGAPLPAISGVITNDDFSRTTLRPQWEWNYQPRADRWSLTERPGYLRLRAFAPLRPHTLNRVGNVLSQRSFKSISNTATVRLELAGMIDGQHAGLCHFSNVYAGLGVSRAGTTNRLTHNVNGVLSYGPNIAGTAIWLRSTWDLAGVSRFSYSTDGVTYTAFGGTYQLAWGSYRGDHVGVYTYNAGAAGGYVDVDTFEYTTAPARAYTITNAGSGKVVDVFGGSSTTGAAIIQWLRTGGTNQQWRFHPTGDGYYTITSMRSGKLLDVTGGATAADTPVVQWPGVSGNGSRNQHWQLRPVTGGFAIVNRQSGLLLDVAAGSTADGAALVQTADRGAASQRWSFTLVG